MWLFLVFVAVPILEIALFIQVGGWIGLWPTIAIVILTALIGTRLMRSQGLAVLEKLQNTVNNGENPMGQIAHGALILVSGVLLLTPGFFTDCCGLLLLVPPVREALIKSGAARMLKGNVVIMAGQGAGPDPRAPRRPPSGQENEDIIDGDYTVEDPEPTAEKKGDSGWTRKQ